MGDVLSWWCDELLLVVFISALTRRFSSNGSHLREVREEKCGVFVASSQTSHAVAAAPSFQTCLCKCIGTWCMRVCINVYVCVCTNMHICIYLHVYMYRYKHACIYMCICMYMHVYAYILSLSSCSSACLDGVIDAHVYFLCICMRLHMCVYIYIYAFFFAFSVACTLEQVFWAPVHVQLYTLYRSSFDINIYICDIFAAGCAHMCICIYMCICVHMHMDAYVRS